MTEEIRGGNPIVAGKVTIVPIERCYIQSVSGEMGGWLFGLKEPLAIIICDSNGVQTFDTKALEISVESLIQKFPVLHTVLESIND